jgi:hypothetical protein
VIRTVAKCFSLAGSHRGVGVTCGTARCRAPAGACCSTLGCQLTSDAQCDAAGGQWIGALSSCNLADCPRNCACDWNGDGTVDIYDLSRFFSDVAAGHYDFDADGRHNNDDIRAFTECWQHPHYGC